MSSKEFIIDKMNKFVGIFPTTRIRYDYHLLSKTHTLEVVPGEVYHLDEGFKAWEEALMFEFIDSYPDESLSLVTDDSFFGIDKVDFELFGSHFFNTPTTNTVTDNFYTPAYHQNMWDLLKDFAPDYHASITTNFFGEQTVSNTIELVNFSLHTSITNNETLSDHSTLEISDSSDTDSSSITYALAA